MGTAKQTATRQMKRFIPVFSFGITRSRQDTTDSWRIQVCELLWRRRLAGVFEPDDDQKTSRQDAGATKPDASSLFRRIGIATCISPAP
jgi:hypothetical protein